jgi:hypothetical protein
VKAEKKQRQSKERTRKELRKTTHLLADYQPPDFTNLHLKKQKKHLKKGYA